ncbi:MAG: class II D-tagatose-bisphosphate aldolase non-catalytic subunit [Chloroflexota bacterium]
MVSYILDDIVHNQKKGIAAGIVSICSANPFVLKSAMLRACQNGRPVLIEATCNQVNQYGGYSGKTPRDFAREVRELAESCGLSSQQILLGGDHLGPYVWRSEPAQDAMGKACEMVRAYVEAGFTKIHVDASMLLGDDRFEGGTTELFAQRTAELVKAAEDAAGSADRQADLRYVVGNEVPLPGGATRDDSPIQVSNVEETRQVISSVQEVFQRAGLQSAWERVIAIVVQPGVEFSHDTITEYQRALAKDLSGLIEGYSNLVYEAHSTDYQTALALRQLVEDHFAILKVGPALTFAFREAVFALAMIEEELYRCRFLSSSSQVVQRLDKAMLDEPRFWQPYYGGDEHQQAFARKYSFSDRCRYYWPVRDVQLALERLLQQLTQVPIPLSLLSQYMPVQYLHLREGKIPCTPEALIFDRVAQVLEDYEFACSPREEAGHGQGN